MVTLNAIKRKELVDKLLKAGIKDKYVLEAINKVKREFFVNEEFKKFSYDNNALPIDCQQTISQPYTVAFMTELLEIKQGSKILEIGTGSGYQSAILKELGAEIYSVERISELMNKAKITLSNLNYNVHLKCDDGALGWEEFAPYDGIIVTAGSPSVPNKLKEQLNEKGILVIPIGNRSVQQIWKIQRMGKDFKIDKHSDFKFVPLQWEEGWA